MTRAMLHFARHKVSPVRVEKQGGLNCAIVRFRAATREDDLGGFTAQERGDLFPCGIDGFCGAFAKRIGAGRVSVLILKIWQHQLKHFGIDLCRSVVVEVNHKDVIGSRSRCS